MSYFPEDIPFMSKEELRENGIRIPKDVTDIRVGDTISRQAAIARAVPLNLFGREVMIVPVSELENLPFAQPEIIHCKDCRYSEYGYSEYDVVYGERYCHYDGKADVVPDLHFCGFAERREE